MKDVVPQMACIGDIGDTLHPPHSDCTAERSEDAFNLSLWVHNHQQDFAVKFFILLLKEHLLSRIPGAHQPSNVQKIFIQNDQLYSHAMLQVNYTTYDIRRQQDTINPRTPCRFVILSADTDASKHPFLYAKVLGIYHANVRFDRRPARRMNFLWVCWLEYDEETPGGWEVCRLDRVFYGKCRNDYELMNGFGFIAPHHIICAAHLIPDFESGTTNQPRHTMSSDNKESDWKYHYVSRLVDRNMFMCYLGGGIGHFNQCPPSECVEDSTYDIDDEGEALDINEIQAEAEGIIELDDEDSGSGESAALAGPNTDRDEWWREEDDNTDGNATGSDSEPEEEGDGDFIVDLYDL
ncbi:hypothetical protein OPQ81_005390 [Rhizoctonia solani]|nr:hypothetical protein OPQ81_005390 [Rhizoctonia solani]